VRPFLRGSQLAASEANFFASAPVIAHQIVRAGATQPIDMLVGGFTLTGVGVCGAPTLWTPPSRANATPRRIPSQVSLLMSERFQIPVVNYCLQPTCIPSTDANWQSVVPIESHTVLTFLDTLEERYFTGHAALQPLKRMMESNPFSAVSLPKLRAAYGLQPSDTWTAIMQQKLPVVIPMAPITFERPPGWTERIACTDFIFLRAAPKIGVVAKLSDVVERFCDAAVASGRKLVLMSFSSMPVPYVAPAPEPWWRRSPRALAPI
jgi:sterol 3beta-glucosyltransferase